MKKGALLAAIALAASAAGVYTLNSMDQIIHGTLYQYGLQFSYEWANPYWSLLRITQILFAVSIATALASMVITLKPLLGTAKLHVRTASIPRAKKNAHMTSRDVEKARPTPTTSKELSESTRPFHPQESPQVSTSERTPKHQPSTPTLDTPPHSYTSSDANGFIRCPNCAKSFSQPLRMLDFQSDRPRIVDTCPFCGQTLTQAARAEERKQGQDNGFSVAKDNRNGQKTITH